MAQEKKIGLALSGGGVRAAAFHLGVLDKLNELGILDEVDVISTVSGGSITGAFYMTQKDDFNRFKDIMLRNLKVSIEKKTLLNWRIIGAAINPNYSRTDVKADVYDKLYFDGKTFSSLSDKPELIINATNLATGKNWRFSKKRMGDWKIGFDGMVDGFKISKAVAASSAVPGIFQPIRINVKDYFANPGFSIKKISLCDGGVYDNQGTHALLSKFEDEQACNYIICSDASFPFDDTPTKAPYRPVGVLTRQSNIMMARIKNLQYADLLYGKYEHSVKTAYFAINWDVDGIIKSLLSRPALCKEKGVQSIIDDYDITDPDEIKTGSKEFKEMKEKIISHLGYPEFSDYLNEDDVDFVSSIGTRLYALSDRQINFLVKHAASLCGIQVRLYLSDLLGARPPL